MRRWVGRLGVWVLVELCFAQGALGFYLDAGRRFNVRLRAYAQLGILTERSERAGCPTAAEIYRLNNGPQFRGPANRTARLTERGRLDQNCLEGCPGPSGTRRCPTTQVRYITTDRGRPGHVCPGLSAAHARGRIV